MSKKNLPLSVLKALEPFVGLQGQFFTIEDPGKNLLHAKDKDPSSKFYYAIEKCEIANDGREIYSINFAPKDEKDVRATAVRILRDDLTQSFNTWVLSLENYDKVKSFFDDPVLQSYQAEFVSNYEFLDEDADTDPLPINQIILLDNFLEDVGRRLLGMANDTNREEIQTIAAEIVELRENLSTRSKKWIVEKMSKVYAQIAKQGVKFIKEFWDEGKKEIIKTVVKAVIEHGPDLLN